MWRATAFSAVGTFTDWKPLVYENDEVDWYGSGSPEQVVIKQVFWTNCKFGYGTLWLFYHGVRADENVNPCVDLSTNIASMGRVSFGDCNSQTCGFVE